MGEELGPFTEAELMKWARRKRQERDEYEPIPRCGAEHPDWTMTCTREPHTDETHEGGYGETWVSAPAITADERFEFWTGWTRGLIAWMLGLTIVTVLSTLLPYGWAHTVTFVGLAMLIVTPATFAWEAIQFVREHGRARS